MAILLNSNMKSEFSITYNHVFLNPRYLQWLLIPLILLGSMFLHPLAAEDLIVRVGVYENSPKVFTDPSGKPAGIFIDIIEYIARAEGWELQYVRGTWGEGLDRLESGEIDLMPDVAYTAARDDVFDFHKEFVLSSWFRIYARKGSGIRSILDLSGKRITVLEQSVQEEAFKELVDSFGLKVTLISLENYAEVFALVEEGNAEAAITNRFYGVMHAEEYNLEDTSVVFYPSMLFFAASEGKNEVLLKTIDSHLIRLKKDINSEYYKSLERWTSEKVAFVLPHWLIIIAIIIGAVFLASLAGSVLLKHQVDNRTRELKKYINEQAKIEEALRTSEKKYRELVMLAHSIVLRWKSDGRIIFLNEFGLQFFGFTDDEILGKSLIGTIVPGNSSMGDDLRRMIEEIPGDPHGYEHNINENIRRDGKRVWIAWRNRFILDDRGEVKEILSVGADITELKDAEEKIHKLNVDLQHHAENLEKRVAERTKELAVAK